MEWTGVVNNKGYGVVRVGDTTTTAHRATWFVAYGPIPEGMQVDHLCRNRLCINPDHLELVTGAENYGRSPRVQVTHCPAGHPYAGDNLRLYVDRYGRTHRQCVICRREAGRRYEAKRRGL